MINKLIGIFGVTIVCAIVFSGCASLQYWPQSYRYNYYEKRHELASPKAELKYNVFENEWRYIEK